jgi:WD40 repeat protein
VLIWDDRKGALPLATIEAHESKIYGIDWSRDTSLGLDRLITCSLDGSVKYWDLASPAAQRAVGHRELVTEPEAVIETPTPVWRARHLPFGSGIMTLPQRGDTSLSMWSKERPDAPVERFVGHRDIVKEYLFRTRGGNNRDNDDREWQLLTWSKDQTLRLWPVSEEATRVSRSKASAPGRSLIPCEHRQSDTSRAAASTCSTRAPTLATSRSATLRPMRKHTRAWSRPIRRQRQHRRFCRPPTPPGRC